MSGRCSSSSEGTCDEEDYSINIAEASPLPPNALKWTWTKRIVVACLVLTHVFVVIYPKLPRNMLLVGDTAPCWVEPTAEVSADEIRRNLVVGDAMATVGLSVFLVVSCVLIQREQVDSVSRMSSLCFLFVWVRLLSRSAMNTIQGCADGQGAALAAAIFSSLNLFSGVASTISFEIALKMRVELVEAGFGKSFQICSLGAVVHATFAVGLCTATVTSIGNILFFYKIDVTLAISTVSDAFWNATRSLSYAAFAVIIQGSLANVERACNSAAASGRKTYLQAEAAWAQVVLRGLRLSLVISVATTSMLCLSLGVADFMDEGGLRELLSPALEASFSVLEFLCLFYSVGCFQPARPSIRLGSAPQPAPRLHEGVSGRTPRWLATVDALAERSVDAAELLEFHSKLGLEVMHHYDPRRSTTHDVVRQAIIPLTRNGDGGEAYASVAARSRAATANCYVDCMVTHCWSNLFDHLVVDAFPLLLLPLLH